MGLSKDFTGLSELLLGQAQPAQFQSSGQTGYWWGSKVSDDGNWTVLSDATNNANAEMPRSYNGGSTYANNVYYNWYGATAESGTYDGDAADSICPSGWELPIGREKTIEKTVAHLFMEVYGYASANGTNNSSAISEARKLPLTLSLSAEYGGALGAGGFYWARTAYNGTARAYYYTLDFLHTYGNNAKFNGYSIRCIQK